MSDANLGAPDAKMQRLETERAAREALLADPEYQRIRQLYQNLANALDALDEAGERPADSEGYALSIVGKSFELSGTEITENDARWKRHMRRQT